MSIEPGERRIAWPVDVKGGEGLVVCVTWRPILDEGLVSFWSTAAETPAVAKYVL